MTASGMRGIQMGIGMIYFQIDRNKSSSLYQQLCSEIREKVLRGVLLADERLPSTRELSKELGIARNIVIACYEQLTAEGYVYSKNGSGTYICEGVRLEEGKKASLPLTDQMKAVDKQYTVSFRTGIPDLKKIPLKKWIQNYQLAADKMTEKNLDYQEAFGDFELREHLSLYLNRVRGTRIAPKNLMITNGAAEAFHLLCCLIEKNEIAVVEDPLSYGLSHTLLGAGVSLQGIAVDQNGMRTDQLPKKPVKMIFTTPSHQFPTGAILPAARRTRMIQYARSHQAYIVEDDYDSEFRFEGNPIMSMQSLAPESVIYVGTFSKTLLPSLRIGYMALPDTLCDRLREEKYLSDIHSSILEQRTMTEMLRDGSFEHHIWKMKKWYFKKRNFLVNCLEEVFHDRISIEGAQAGLHMLVYFKNVVFHDAMLKKLADSGIEISAVSRHCLTKETAKQYESALVFGYGNTELEEIKNGIKIMYDVIYGDLSEN